MSQKYFWKNGKISTTSIIEIVEIFRQVVCMKIDNYLKVVIYRSNILETPGICVDSRLSIPTRISQLSWVPKPSLIFTWHPINVQTNVASWIRTWATRPVLDSQFACWISTLLPTPTKHVASTFFFLRREFVPTLVAIRLMYTFYRLGVRVFLVHG